MGSLAKKPHEGVKKPNNCSRVSARYCHRPTTMLHTTTAHFTTYYTECSVYITYGRIVSLDKTIVNGSISCILQEKASRF